jgi:hypothetical protein
MHPEPGVWEALKTRFQAAVKKTFSKVKAFSVGPRSRALLEGGKRLTRAVQSPREFDLTPDSVIN